MEQIPILVTGGCGFLGTSIVSALLSSKRYAVTAIDINPPSLGSSNFTTSVRYVRCNILDLPSLQKVFAEARPALVVHTVGVYPLGVRRYSMDGADVVFQVNVEGTRNVLAASKDCGAKGLVYTSSVTVVLDELDRDFRNVDETWPTGMAKTSYGISKVGSSVSLAAYLSNVHRVVTGRAGQLESLYFLLLAEPQGFSLRFPLIVSATDTIFLMSYYFLVCRKTESCTPRSLSQPRFFVGYLTSGTQLTCHQAVAEELVLSANTHDFVTCALRSAPIFGPNDATCIPTIHSCIAAGQTPFILGTGTNLQDFVYVDNVADAHILAVGNLLNSQTAAGEAIYISNGEPVTARALCIAIWKEFGHVPAFEITVPERLAWWMGWGAEWASWLVGSEGVFSRGIVSDGCRDRYVSIAKANRILGYKPRVDLVKGLEISCKVSEPEVKQHRALQNGTLENTDNFTALPGED